MAGVVSVACEREETSFVVNLAEVGDSQGMNNEELKDPVLFTQTGFCDQVILYFQKKR